jgi:FtsZ-interacting cell division protein ZipA
VLEQPTKKSSGTDTRPFWVAGGLLVLVAVLLWSNKKRKELLAEEEAKEKADARAKADAQAEAGKAEEPDEIEAPENKEPVAKVEAEKADATPGAVEDEKGAADETKDAP